MALSSSQRAFSDGLHRDFMHHNSSTMNLIRVGRVSVQSIRTMFRPPNDVPYAGIYRKAGEIVKENDLIVVQTRLNYHPGANVRHRKDYGEFGRQHHLIADCDGTVMITREHAVVDPKNKHIQKEYAYRNFENLYKLTFHVVPRRMSNRFRLVEEV